MYMRNLEKNKPISLQFTIPERWKTIMNVFVHGNIKPRYGGRAKVCYTDTDSVIYEVQTPYVYKPIAGDVKE